MNIRYDTTTDRLLARDEDGNIDEAHSMYAKLLKEDKIPKDENQIVHKGKLISTTRSGWGTFNNYEPDTYSVKLTPVSYERWVKFYTK
jgi:hypothetical protein